MNKLLTGLLATAFAATASLASAQGSAETGADASAWSFEALQAASSNSSAFQPVDAPVLGAPLKGEGQLSIGEYQVRSSSSDVFRATEPVANAASTRVAAPATRGERLSYDRYQALSNDSAVFAVGDAVAIDTLTMAGGHRSTAN